MDTQYNNLFPKPHCSTMIINLILFALASIRDGGDAGAVATNGETQGYAGATNTLAPWPVNSLTKQEQRGVRSNLMDKTTLQKRENCVCVNLPPSSLDEGDDGNEMNRDAAVPLFPSEQQPSSSSARLFRIDYECTCNRAGDSNSEAQRLELEHILQRVGPFNASQVCTCVDGATTAVSGVSSEYESNRAKNTTPLSPQQKWECSCSASINVVTANGQQQQQVLTAPDIQQLGRAESDRRVDFDYSQRSQRLSAMGGKAQDSVGDWPRFVGPPPPPKTCETTNFNDHKGMGEGVSDNGDYDNDKEEQTEAPERVNYLGPVHDSTEPYARRWEQRIGGESQTTSSSSADDHHTCPPCFDMLINLDPRVRHAAESLLSRQGPTKKAANGLPGENSRFPTLPDMPPPEEHAGKPPSLLPSGAPVNAAWESHGDSRICVCSPRMPPLPPYSFEESSTSGDGEYNGKTMLKDGYNANSNSLDSFQQHFSNRLSVQRRQLPSLVSPALLKKYSSPSAIQLQPQPSPTTKLLLPQRSAKTHSSLSFSPNSNSFLMRFAFSRPLPSSQKGTKQGPLPSFIAKLPIPSTLGMRHPSVQDPAFNYFSPYPTQRLAAKPPPIASNRWTLLPLSRSPPAAVSPVTGTANGKISFRPKVNDQPRRFMPNTNFYPPNPAVKVNWQQQQYSPLQFSPSFASLDAARVTKQPALYGQVHSEGGPSLTLVYPLTNDWTPQQR